MSIGLKRGTIKLEQYDPSWPEYFQMKKRELLKTLNDNNVFSIEHVGSTSIPGLSAKPIIDILITVKNLDKARIWISKFENLGYHFKVENDPRRLFFTEGPEEKRTVYLHIAEQNSKYASDVMVFKDLLIANPEVAHSYEKLKYQLATSAKSREEYTKLKEKFIQEVISAANTGKTKL